MVNKQAAKKGRTKTLLLRVLLKLWIFIKIFCFMFFKQDFIKGRLTSAIYIIEREMNFLYPRKEEARNVSYLISSFFRSRKLRIDKKY